MIITKRYLSRRTVLRGVGAAIGLPLLDAMVPAATAMAKTAAKPVRRLGAVYVPMGFNMPLWTPKTEGALELSPILQPLAAFRDRMVVVSGLDLEEARPRDEAGGSHSRSQAAWLTSARAKKTDGPGFRVGTSMDQIAAQQIGQETALSSLELALDVVEGVGGCNFGYTCAYLSTIAWRTASTPLPMETNPRAVFERLFGASDSTDPRARLLRLQTNRSILDAVSHDITRLQKGIGTRDLAKVTEYLDAVRDVERRVQNAEQSGRELPTVVKPMGIPASFEEHGKVMFDLLALAYQADLTRIGTFMYSYEQNFRTYPELGISEPHHPLSHHQDDPEKLARIAKINVFFMQMFSHLVEKLASTPDGDGTLLDHTILHVGSGMSNSNLHLPLDLPALVVGGQEAQIKGGRHLRYPAGTPLANLHLTLLDRMGVRVDRFADSTGKLTLLSEV